MDKFKDFVISHKNEIFIGFGLIFAYKLGFKRGCDVTNKAIHQIAEDTLQILNF